MGNDRGYGSQHRKLRAQLADLVAQGTVRCSRCGNPIQPGQPWDLDHTADRAGYLGPAHRRCNRVAGAKEGARRRWAKPKPNPSRHWL